MRQYLSSFTMLSREQEEDLLWDDRHTLLPLKYPFDVFRYRELPTFTFGPITIFCGGNGSGKSTILNLIAEKLRLKRGAAWNRSELFEEYVRLCRYQLEYGAVIPPESRIITSDDVFDSLLELRSINSGIDKKRGELFRTYLEQRGAGQEQARLQSLEDYDRWHEIMCAKHTTGAAFVRSRVMKTIRERSNGESALMYFTEKIRENALYLLDEPENSLSAESQLELKRFLEASVRASRCQFVIATHSPFLLSIGRAVIYDLDTTPPEKKPWTEINNVRIYHDFFWERHGEFQNGK